MKDRLEFWRLKQLKAKEIRHGDDVRRYMVSIMGVHGLRING